MDRIPDGTNCTSARYQELLMDQLMTHPEIMKKIEIPELWMRRVNRNQFEEDVTMHLHTIRQVHQK